MASPANYRDFLWRIARVAAARVVCPYYRLAPEHPFPAALDDVLTSYRWLLAQGAAPRAGGNCRRFRRRRPCLGDVAASA